MQHSADPASYASLYIHIRILLGMIVGLGLTHLLRHLARIVERPQTRRIYWVHLVWAGFMFVYLLHFWWWEFQLSHQGHWNFNLYLFVTLYALMLYLLCALVFPESVDDYEDYRAYFYARRHWFFGFLAVLFAMDVVDTLIKGEAYYRHLGWEYPLRNAAYIVGSLGAIATRSHRYHGTFAIAALLYELSWIWRRYEILA
ncbi:hypothetical protein OVA13_02850 [Pseudoxanthomonas sp. SL93]|jgi:hypothetical protein|uniref:hypothetical protein n=1 Tax=Pseudoxanthomonas sp. SL93 TaxID=2995142 RepID=UPI00227022D1|nr:hypothetical protein [Pseudoxanthomonas sp. SL93]WAC63744.1 hypothetical protein OVA13_02850 [Pseudoxanthomonas sp. SL93]